MSAGEAERWRRVAAVLLTEADRLDTAFERARKLIEVGDLYRDRLGSPGEASEYYFQAVTVDANQPEQPLSRLAQLARETGDVEVTANLVAALSHAGHWEDVVTVLVRQADGIPDPAERAGLLLEAGRTAQQRLGDGERARECFLRAAPEVEGEAREAILDELRVLLTARPDDAQAALAYARAATRAGHPLEAVSALTRAAAHVADLHTKASLLFDAAILCADRTAQPVEALVHLYEAAVLDPELTGQVQARMDATQDRWVHVPEVADTLQSIYERLQQPERVHRVMRARYEAAAPAEQPGLLLALAEHAEYQLLDAPLAFELYREGLERGDGEPGAFAAGMRRVGAEGVPGAVDAMTDLFGRLGMWRALVHVLDGEAAVQVEDADRAELLYRAGEVLETRLEDLEGAMERYQRAFKLAPGEVRYLAAGERLYRRRGDWRMVDRLLALQARAAVDAPTRQRLYIEQARVRHRHLERPMAAYESARQALAEEMSEVAVAAMRDLVRDDAAFAEIERALRAQAADEGGTAASRILLELAALHLEVRDSPREGRAALREAADLRPEDPGLFERVVDACEADEAWRELADWLMEAPRRPLSEAERDAAVRRAAGLYDELEAHAEAREAWRRVIDADPDDAEAAAHLLAAARAADAPDALADLLDRVLSGRLGPEPDATARRDVLRELATARASVGDPAAATEAWAAVAALAPLDDEALTFLRDRYTRTEAWESLRSLLEAAAEARRAADEGPPEALLRELAELAEQRLEDARLAAVYLRELLDAESAPGPIHAELRRLYGSAGDREGELGLLALELGAATDDAQRAELAERLVELASRSPVDATALGRGYTELADLRPDDLQLLDRWAEQLRGLDADAELVEVLGRRWAAAPTVEHLDVLRERARRLGGLDRDDEAAEAWRAVLERAPDDVDAMAALQGVEAARGDDEAVLALLWRRHEAASEPREALVLLREAAVVAEVRLGDAGRAIEAWRAALDAETGVGEALDELVRLYEAVEDWEKLVEVGARRLDELDPPDRIELARRLARCCADPLDRVEEAARYWEVVRSIDPFDAEALAALVDAAETDGDLERAAELLARVVETAPTSKIRRGALERRVELLVKLDRLAEAIELLDAVRALVPTERGPVRRQRELAFQRKDWLAAARALEAERALVHEADERLELDRTLARIHGDELGDLVGAAADWERVLERSPRDAEALRALKALYVELERPDELVRVLRVLLDLARDDAARVRLLTEAGRLTEQLRGDLGEAFECWRRAFALSDHVRTDLLGEMRRLAAAGDLWDRYLQVLDTAQTRARDREQRAGVLLEQAEVAEAHLEDPEQAFERARAAFELDPGEGKALDKLADLAERAGRWRDVIEAWRAVAESADRPRRVALFCRAAEAALTHLDEPGLAFELYGRAVESGAGSQVEETLVQLVETHGLWERLTDLYTRRWQSLSQLKARIATLHALARLLEERAGDWERAFEQYLIALQLDPRDDASRRETWRLAGEHDAWSIVARVVELKAKEAKESWLKIALLQDLAELQAGPLGEPEQAFETLRKAFAVETWNAQTHAALRAVAGELGAWRQLAGFLEEEAGWAEERHARLRLYREAADVMRAHGEPSEAARILRHVAELAPDETEVVDELLELLRAADDPLALAAALERHARHGERPRQAALLAELAALYAGPLDAPSKAEQVLQRLLALKPEDDALFDELIEVLARRQAWKALDELLEQRARHVPPERRLPLLRRRAELLRDRLGRGREAWKLLLRVARETPEDLELLFELAERVDEAQGHAELLACAERSADVAEPEHLPRVLMLVGRTARDRFGNEKKAQQALTRALEMRPDDLGLAREVTALLRRRKRYRALVELYLRVGPPLLEVEDDEADDARRDRWALEVAAMQADRLYRVDAAIETLRAALAADGAGSTPVLRRLLDLAERAQDGPHLHEAARALASALPVDDAIQVFAHGARALAGMGEAERAADLWRAALERAPEHPQAHAELRQYAERRRDWDLLAEELATRAATAEGAERAAAYVELGELERTKRGDEDAARAAWASALDADAGCVEALEALADLARRRDDEAALDALTDRLEVQLEETEDAERLAGLASTLLLRRAEREVDDPEAVIAALRQARKAAPDDAAVAQALADAHYRHGELAEAAAVYLDLPVRGDHKGREHLQRARAFRSISDDARALRHYEAAAQDPATRVDALEALANLQESAGRWEAAVRLREKLAEAFTAPADRAATLMSAGVIVETRLGKPARAMNYYHRALESGLAEPVMLRRILDLCVEHKRCRPAIDIVERLLESTTDANQRAELLCVRGDLHRVEGETLTARAAYAAALDASPIHAEAVCGLLETLNDAPADEQLEAIARVRAVLDRVPARARVPVLRPLAARCAELGRVAEAIELYEAVRLAEPDDDAVGAALAELYPRLEQAVPDDPTPLERAIPHRLARLRAHPADMASLRALVALRRAAGQARRATPALRLLDALGVATEAERAEARGARGPLAAGLEARLQKARRGDLLDDAAARSPVGMLMKALHEWAGAALDPHFRAAEGAGEPADVLHPSLAERADALARALELTGRRVWLTAAEDRTVSLARLHPPELLVGGGLAGDVSNAAQRFILARALELTRGPSVYAAYVPEVEAHALFAASVALALPDRGPEYAVATSANAERLEHWAGFLAHHLEPSKLDALAQFAGPAVAAGPQSFDDWCAAARASASRVGLVACGDLVLALRVVLGERGLEPPDSPEGYAEALRRCPEAADLHRFVFGPQFEELMALPAEG